MLIYSAAWELKSVGLEFGVPICCPPPQACFIFLDSCFSGEEKGELGGPLVGNGKVNSWYHSISSNISWPRPSQKSGRSPGEPKTCFPALVTSRVNGKRHVYLRSRSVSLSKRGLSALWFLV